jgi:hypothetical protein
MFRLLFYALLAFIIFKIFRVVNQATRHTPPPPPPPNRPPGQKQDFKNVQDAEFEDITPKKPPQGEAR